MTEPLRNKQIFTEHLNLQSDIIKLSYSRTLKIHYQIFIDLYAVILRIQRYRQID